MMYFKTLLKFLFPSILMHWASYQSSMIIELKSNNTPSTWSGDGCFDSMGHGAKYGITVARWVAGKPAQATLTSSPIIFRTK